MENLNNCVQSITVVRKYPSTRDSFVNGCWKWLEGKEVDDKAEGLWRVHNKLYDLTDFICKHPGGQEWLEMTKGTDITEAYESHHLSKIPSQILPQYYISDAIDKRNYYYTYDENGFYKTLQRRVIKKLETIDKSVVWKSKLLLDLDLALLFIASIMAFRAESQNWIIFWILIAGQSLAWLANFSHNFIHQKNNWRMYAANLTLLSWRDYRVFHVLSHHMYPNSYADLEVSTFEPYFKWIPRHVKTWYYKFFTIIMAPVMYVTIFHNIWRFRTQGYIWAKNKVFHFDELLMLTLPVAMVIFGRDPIDIDCLKKVYNYWAYIAATGALLYAIVFLNRGHHSPDLNHQGDLIKSMDFGEYQLSTVSERAEANRNIFTINAYFGEQLCHQLFPSLDHALLPQLKDVLLQTCKEFDVDLHKCSMLQATIGQIKQLYRENELIKLY